jgi:hypothetical protein
MADDDALRRADDDLPVVARLVIEIRSDGTRTVARGGLEQAPLPGAPDMGAPERVAIEARGGSPAALAADLLRAIVTMPFQSSLSRWTGRDGHVVKASLTRGEDGEHGDASSPAAPRPGLVGRVQRELSGRLRRRLGMSR